jgi:hypothetical protein
MVPSISKAESIRSAGTLKAAVIITDDVPTGPKVSLSGFEVVYGRLNDEIRFAPV